jgi:hypothetical protein
MNTLKISLLSVALVAALAAAGCGGGGSGSTAGVPAPTPTPTPAPTPTPTPPPTGEGFTGWSKTSVFALPEAGAPVIMDELVFSFDGDDNPTAYSDLLPVE